MTTNAGVDVEERNTYPLLTEMEIVKLPWEIPQKPKNIFPLLVSYDSCNIYPNYSII